MAETVNQAPENQEPEKTFTQAELDKIVGERLGREREKYSDYETLKEKASKFEELEEANKSELQKATERATALENELNTLKKENEIRTIRENVSKETGVPVNLLNGGTLEECIAQAEAIRSYANPGYPTVKDKGEIPNAGGGSARQQFVAWANQALN